MTGDVSWCMIRHVELYCLSMLYFRAMLLYVASTCGPLQQIVLKQINRKKKEKKINEASVLFLAASIPLVSFHSHCSLCM